MRMKIMTPLALVAALASGCATTTSKHTIDARDEASQEAAYQANVRAALAEQDPEVAYAKLRFCNVRIPQLSKHLTLVAKFTFMHLPEKFNPSAESLYSLMLSKYTAFGELKINGGLPDQTRLRIMAHIAPDQQVLLTLAGHEEVVPRTVRTAVQRLCTAPRWEPDMEEKDDPALAYYAARACGAWVNAKREEADRWISKMAARIAASGAAPEWLDINALGKTNAAPRIFAKRLYEETGIDISQEVE